MQGNHHRVDQQFRRHIPQGGANQRGGCWRRLHGLVIDPADSELIIKTEDGDGRTIKDLIGNGQVFAILCLDRQLLSAAPVIPNGEEQADEKKEQEKQIRRRKEKRTLRGQCR